MKRSVPVGAPLLGTQGVHRAISVLREISIRERQGLRLVDIATSLKLERPTAHRILKGLVNEGMVRQDPDTQRYHLGHVVYELGLCVPPHFNLKEICEPMLLSLAQKTEDSIFLVVRSGLDVVCIHNLEGSFPIKTRTLEIGGRRPLGVGAGSLALLMALDANDIEQVIEVNTPRFARFGRQTPERLRAAIARSREAGYAVNNEDVLSGVSAIGMVLQRRTGVPFAAVSIAAISSRMEDARRHALAQLLRKEVRAIETRIEALAPFWD